MNFRVYMSPCKCLLTHTYIISVYVHMYLSSLYVSVNILCLFLLGEKVFNFLIFSKGHMSLKTFLLVVLDILRPT